jgi:hypothetical protein
MIVVQPDDDFHCGPQSDSLRLQQVLGTLEGILAELDRLQLHLPGAFVSQAIDHVRSQIAD